MAIRSSSSSNDVSILSRFKYLIQLTLMNFKRSPLPAKVVIAELDSIIESYDKKIGATASKKSVVEIGFGGRPFRAFALQAYFEKVVAVDLEQPIFGFAEFLAARKTNGNLRAIKGLIRAIVFDFGEWKSFHKQMKDIYPVYAKDKSKLVVSNAASDDFWKKNPGPYDLIFSTDVFEHIDVESLTRLLIHMKENLSKDGICIIRPMIYTGIEGGHDLEWYGNGVEINDSENAWRHLWDQNFTVDTYLNKLSRRDYVRMFETAGFEIMEDRALKPDHGRKHLTAENKSKLNDDWDEYELFSNLTQFTLKTKH